MTIAYVGLGSNLSDPMRQIASALTALRSLPETTVLAQSSFYLSRPLGDAGQPDYVNAAVKLETALTAGILMKSLLAIEVEHGRVRGPRRWQPRTLDLDLLIYGRERISSEDLVVPHPEIANRNFVLLPLAEITPDLNIPDKGKVTDLLADVGMAGIEKINQE